MKKVILFVAFALSMFTLTAQANENTVDVNGLTEKQKAELTLQVAKLKERAGVSNTTEMVNTTKEVLSGLGSVGKEVGVAVHEGLNAVVDVANKFSGTPVGVITIALIVWKVAGASIVLLITAALCIPAALRIVYRLLSPKFKPFKWELRPRLWGLYEKRVPIAWAEETHGETEIVISVVAALILTIVGVMSLVNAI